MDTYYITELIIKINEIHRHLDFYLNKETYRQLFLYHIKKISFRYIFEWNFNGNRKTIFQGTMHLTLDMAWPVISNGDWSLPKEVVTYFWAEIMTWIFFPLPGLKLQHCPEMKTKLVDQILAKYIWKTTWRSMQALLTRVVSTC